MKSVGRVALFFLLCGFLPAAVINPADVDINGDLTIDIMDISALWDAWLSHDGPSDDWNPACDVSAPPDGVIDALDLAKLTSDWLVTIPEPNEFICPADMNKDFRVNMEDYSILSAAWLSDDSPSANWNPDCDISHLPDGVINEDDFLVLAANWLRMIPDPNDYADVPDINNDFSVDLLDYSIFSSAWLSDDQPALNWDPNCDFPPTDGRINAFDFAVFAVHWQFTIPDPDQFVFIPGGQFEMGNHHEDFMPEATPVHTVQVDSFYMGRFPITNQQYCQFLNASMAAGELIVDANIVYGYDDTANSFPYFGTNAVDSYSRIEYSEGVFTVIDKANHPLVQVSWYGSVAYCNWLSEQQGRQSCYDLSTWQCDFTQSGYRLATEAEWEYAARGGLYAPYYRYFWGDVIDGSKANYFISGDPYENTTPVGYYDGNQIPAGDDMANGFGLYDMAGNVLEWCNDWYDAGYYSVSPIDNPKGPVAGVSRVVRGGSWNNVEKFCLVAFRDKPHIPSERSGSYGFRICLPAPGAD